MHLTAIIYDHYHHYYKTITLIVLGIKVDMRGLRQWTYTYSNSYGSVAAYLFAPWHLWSPL